MPQADLLEFRHMLEGQAATLAAERASDAALNVLIGHLTASLLRVIHGHISRSALRRLGEPA